MLAPLWIAGKRLRGSAAGAPVEVLIALLWGAFVGIIKAGRLGYLVIDDKTLVQASAACWRLIAPETGTARATDVTANDLTLPPALTPRAPTQLTPPALTRRAPRKPTRSTARRRPRTSTPKGK